MALNILHRCLTAPSKRLERSYHLRPLSWGETERWGPSGSEMMKTVSQIGKSIAEIKIWMSPRPDVSMLLYGVFSDAQWPWEKNRASVFCWLSLKGNSYQKRKKGHQWATEYSTWCQKHPTNDSDPSLGRQLPQSPGNRHVACYCYREFWLKVWLSGSATSS